jgi:hypothetical protein
MWTVESFRWRLRTSVGRITEGKLPPAPMNSPNFARASSRSDLSAGLRRLVMGSRHLVRKSCTDEMGVIVALLPDCPSSVIRELAMAVSCPYPLKSGWITTGSSTHTS